MTDKFTSVDAVRWLHVLPWLHLLRAAQLSLRGRTVLLALAAVLVFAVMQLLIARLPFGQTPGMSPPILRMLGVDYVSESGRQFSHRLDLNPSHPNGRIWLAWPWIATLQPGWSMFFGGSNSWPRLATHWTVLLSSLLIWGVFGGAICRSHALRFARDEGTSPIQAVRFTGRLWQSYLYAPLLPYLGVGAFWLSSCAVGQLDNWLANGRGTVLIFLGWIPTLASLAMSLLLLLIASSWPLMVAAISVEGSDGFDGLSRAFGYVMNRPWYYVFLVLLAAVVGLLTDYFAFALFSMTFELARLSSGDGGFNESMIWRSFLTLLHLAVLVSYFWSATTVIYFLLRQSDDGTALDQVYIPGPAPKSEPLPLVGTAASQQPVIERPATQPNVDSAPPSST